MAGSVAKLDSIVAIARAEAETLGEHLRLVILSDRVRADELPRRPGIPFAPTRLGVVPIFEALRRAEVVPDALAVLTGTLVILPVAAGEALDAEASAMRIPAGRLCRRALGGCPGHFSLEAEGDSAQALVALVDAAVPARRDPSAGRHPGIAWRGMGRAGDQQPHPGEQCRLIHAVEPDARPGNPGRSRSPGQGGGDLASRDCGRWERWRRAGGGDRRCRLAGAALRRL